MANMHDSQDFRRILGRYPTGVCVVTTIDQGMPVGMVVGSFTSVSLAPPLVAFLPDRRSETWARIEKTGQFCVNVLSDRQRDVCQALTSKAADKFDTIEYRLSDHGLPIIDGIVAWIDCELHAVHEAGDHFIVVGAVRALAADQADDPLVFHRGGYASVMPRPVDMEART